MTGTPVVAIALVRRRHAPLLFVPGCWKSPEASLADLEVAFKNSTFRAITNWCMFANSNGGDRSWGLFTFCHRLCCGLLDADRIATTRLNAKPATKVAANEPASADSIPFQFPSGCRFGRMGVGWPNWMNSARHTFMYDLILLAQQSRYDRGLSIFQWGLTGVGVAILLAAAGVIFSRSKDPAKQRSPVVKAIAAVVFLALGFGIIGYAWLGF
jgi:hypothetical protein